MIYMCVLVFVCGSIVLCWFVCIIFIRNIIVLMLINYVFKLIIYVEGFCILLKVKGCKM